VIDSRLLVCQPPQVTYSGLFLEHHIKTANVLLAAGQNLAEADSAPEPRFVLES